MRALFIISLVFFAQSARAADAHIVYVTGSSYYVDAGRNDSVIVGQQFEILRDGTVVGHLIARHVSSSRAACDLLDGDPPAVGDLVSYSPSVIVEEAALPRASRPGRDTFRGVVSLRQYALLEHEGYSSDLYRPALDLRLDGRSIGGHPVDLEVDLRTQRSFYSAADDESRTRVYRLQGIWRPEQGLNRLAIGRQRHGSLPSLGSFDGLSADFGSRDAHLFGVAAGTQPDVEDWSYSTDLFEAAAFAEGRWRLADGLTTLGFAGVGSYAESEISREYGVLRASYRGGRSYLLAHQELDLNRGWKKDAEGSSFDATNRYLTARYRLHHRLTVSAGMDSRRTLRLYRDRETPETEFDDSFRTGVWAGMRTAITRSTDAEFQWRTRSGGASGSMDAFSLWLRRIPVPWTQYQVGARGSYYTNDFYDGWLTSLWLRGDWHRLQWRTEGGWRQEYANATAYLDESAWWAGLEGNFRLDASWSAVMSWDHFGGGNDRRDDLYGGLSYRF